MTTFHITFFLRKWIPFQLLPWQMTTNLEAENHTHFLSQFLWVEEVGTAWFTGFSSQGLMRPKSRCGPATSLTGGSEEECASWIILLLEGSSCTEGGGSPAPSIFTPCNVGVLTLLISSACSWRQSSAFKGVCD